MTAILPGKKPLLLAFDRSWKRETAVVLREHFTVVIDFLGTLGVRVGGLIADNAANFQLALSQIETEKGVARLRCQAHAANLLLQDYANEFPETFKEASSVVDFFRFCHYARTTYLTHMKIVPGATDLRQALLRAGHPKL